MTDEQRKLAAIDQIQRYFYSYYVEWRYGKILTTRKILETKFDFYADLIGSVKQSDDETGERTIAQEITNGLVFSALSESLQYIEDLFLFLKFSEKPEWFIKNIITYSAGKVTKYVDAFSTERNEVCKSFYIPIVPDQEWPNADARQAYSTGIDNLIANVVSIKEFFKQNGFFYSQYKHGLTIALRPYGLFSDENLAEQRQHPTQGYLVACDNLSIEKVFRESGRFNQLVFLPTLADNVRAHFSALLAEDNLLRFVPHPKHVLDINEILICAQKIMSCIVVFRNNYISTIKGGNLDIWLPKGEAFFTFPFTKAED